MINTFMSIIMIILVMILPMPMLMPIVILILILILTPGRRQAAGPRGDHCGREGHTGVRGLIKQHFISTV